MRRWTALICGLLASVMGCGLTAFGTINANAQASDDPGALELVDPQVFRACGDPRNLPFSNDKGEGFENKLAELFAAKLGKKLSYTYVPQATGFVRMTLGTYRCDTIMGFPQGDDQAQATVPYYRTSYALVVKPGSGLEDVTAINDPRLKDKRIGVVARTPPSTTMAINGLLAKAESYPLRYPRRFLGAGHGGRSRKGEIEVAILWGPMAGYFASRPRRRWSSFPSPRKGGPPMTFRIGMAVRQADEEWKRTLNKLIMENQAEINQLLIDYNIPILDETNAPITKKTVYRSGRDDDRCALGVRGAGRNRDRRDRDGGSRARGPIGLKIIARRRPRPCMAPG